MPIGAWLMVPSSPVCAHRLPQWLVASSRTAQQSISRIKLAFLLEAGPNGTSVTEIIAKWPCGSTAPIVGAVATGRGSTLAPRIVGRRRRSCRDHRGCGCRPTRSFFVSATIAVRALDEGKGNWRFVSASSQGRGLCPYLAMEGGEVRNRPQKMRTRAVGAARVGRVQKISHRPSSLIWAPAPSPSGGLPGAARSPPWRWPRPPP